MYSCVSYFVPLYNALANNIDSGFESKLYILSSYCIISKIYFCIESDAQLFEVIESYIGQRIVFFNFFLTSTVCSILCFHYRVGVLRMLGRFALRIFISNSFAALTTEETGLYLTPKVNELW